jgi:hypothetical protein
MVQAGCMAGIALEQRRDGKLYPLGGVLEPAERNRARWLAHNLVCRDHLSIREAQRVMLSQHGIRRSLGIIHRDLASYQCPVCAEPGG